MQQDAQKANQSNKTKKQTFRKDADATATKEKEQKGERHQGEQKGKEEERKNTPCFMFVVQDRFSGKDTASGQTVSMTGCSNAGQRMKRPLPALSSSKNVSGHYSPTGPGWRSLLAKWLAT